jgi:hypothetical protein
MMIPVHKCAPQMQCAHNDIIQQYGSTSGTLRALDWELTQAAWQKK